MAFIEFCDTDPRLNLYSLSNIKASLAIPLKCLFGPCQKVVRVTNTLAYSTARINTAAKILIEHALRPVLYYS
jgi:hypothetical protein